MYSVVTNTIRGNTCRDDTVYRLQYSLWCSYTVIRSNTCNTLYHYTQQAVGHSTVNVAVPVIRSKISNALCHYTHQIPGYSTFNVAVTQLSGATPVPHCVIKTHQVPGYSTVNVAITKLSATTPVTHCIIKTDHVPGYSTVNVAVTQLSVATLVTHCRYTLHPEQHLYSRSRSGTTPVQIHTVLLHTMCCDKRSLFNTCANGILSHYTHNLEQYLHKQHALL